LVVKGKLANVLLTESVSLSNDSFVALSFAKSGFSSMAALEKRDRPLGVDSVEKVGILNELCSGALGE